jgi:hypothetical protein
MTVGWLAIKFDLIIGFLHVRFGPKADKTQLFGTIRIVA